MVVLYSYKSNLDFNCYPVQGHIARRASILRLIKIAFETGPHYEVHVGLELVVTLPQPSACWDYRFAVTDVIVAQPAKTQYRHLIPTCTCSRRHLEY